MAAILMDGPLSMSLSRDDNGYRTYKLKLLIRITDTLDGPAIASNAPGLPQPGDPWLVDNDLDVWVWCRPEASISRHTGYEDGHPVHFYVAEYTYSNKPLTKDQAERRRACHEQQIEDPLLEPDRVSGDFQKKSKEVTHDRFGEPILTSSHEIIRGPQVEFDESRPTVKVVQNRPLLQFDLLCTLIDGVNDTPLWNFPARWVKFSSCTWEEQYHGLCYKYYTRTLGFEVREDWDKDLLDEGTKVLNGHWGDGGQEGSAWVLDKIAGADPDPTNLSHFIKATDRHGDPIRMILDGEGKPATRSGHTITNITWDGADLIEVTTATAHGASVGDTVTIVGVDPPAYNDEYEVAAVIGTTGIQFEVSDIPEGLDLPYVRGGTLYVEGNGPGSIHVERYRSVNLLLLGIPVVIGP